MSGLVTIRTPRTLLEPTGPEQADGIWAAVRASLTELQPWMAWAVDTSLEKTRSFTRRARAGWEEGAEWVFTIFYDDEVGGTVGLNHHEELLASANLGYWIRSDLAGGGLATEVSSAVVGFGFDRVGLRRIELRAGIENPASNRVALKLGFKREGLVREGGRGLHGFHDMYQYGLLRSDERPAFHEG